MLIVALGLAVIGLAALITAVVTSNELVAWVCIAASALGVLLLIIDAVRERTHSRLAALATESDEDADDAEAAPSMAAAENTATENTATENTATENTSTENTSAENTSADTEFIEYSTEIIDPVVVNPVDVDPVIVDSVMEAEDHPEELVHDEPEYDLPSDDEPEFVAPAEESAIHIVDEQSGSDDQLIVLQADDLPDSTAVIEYGDTGYDRDDR
jgi:hypothetical protein